MGKPGDVFAPSLTWRGRGYAFLRALGFVLLAFAMALVCMFAMRVVVGHKAVAPSGHFSIFTVLGEWLSFAVFLAATAMMAWLAHRPIGRYGLGGVKAWRNLAIGLIAGAFFLAVQLALAWALGVYSFGTVSALSWRQHLSWALLYAAFFLAVALFEEISGRGVLLVELSQAVSFWPAAVLLGVGFGALHLLNGAAESVFGAVSAGLFGVLFAVLFRLTGSLWLSIGLHGGWDYAESYLFGVPNSGMALGGGLLHPNWHGPLWLTGGSVGPEASVLVLIPFAGMLALGLFLSKDRQPSTTPQP